MRCTILAAALLIGGSSIVNAQSEFNLDSKSQSEVGFFSDSKPMEATPLIGDRFEARFQEPPSFGSNQNNFVSKPATGSNGSPTWAAPQPVVAIQSPLQPQSKTRLQTSTGVSTDVSLSPSANFGAGYIPGVNQWAPGGPSAPRSLPAYLQCGNNDCLWAGYSQKQSYRHSCGNCCCQSMATQHFGHVCRAPGCASGSCGSGSCLSGGCMKAGVSGSIASPADATAAPCNSCLSQTNVQANAESYGQAMAPKTDGKVAQLWPMPSLFGSKSDQPVSPSKTSSSHQELPMTFR